MEKKDIMDHRKATLNNRVCPWWLLPTFDNPFRRIFHRPEKIFKGLVKMGDRVLDMGCGMGYFTIPLARLVGDSGRVTAVDLQDRMLDGLSRRAAQAGMLDRIEIRQAKEKQIDLEPRFDFCLAFWMLHEVPDQRSLLVDIFQWLRPGAKMLLVEPKIHVSGKDFDTSIETAKTVGFQIHPSRPIWGSRSMLLSRDRLDIVDNP